jgi:hypothetical protein
VLRQTGVARGCRPLNESRKAEKIISLKAKDILSRPRTFNEVIPKRAGDAPILPILTLPIFRNFSKNFTYINTPGFALLYAAADNNPPFTTENWVFLIFFYP